MSQPAPRPPPSSVSERAGELTSLVHNPITICALRSSFTKFLQEKLVGRDDLPLDASAAAAAAIPVALLDVEETPDGRELFSPPLEAPSKHRVGPACPKAAGTHLKQGRYKLFVIIVVDNLQYSAKG